MAETLTFLFTDIEGSTGLWERFPDAMKGALSLHDAFLRGAIEASGGRVVKSTGDGTLAVFHSAAGALNASLTAQRDLAAASWPQTGPLRVRMGVHAGQAEQRANDYFGPTVIRAARIMAAGHGGQILLSAAVASAVSGALPRGTTLLDLGEHRLKGLTRAERIFQLVHADLASKFPPLVTASLMASLPARATVFVGRQVELAQIKDKLADGTTRLLTLIGPAGTGKTSLALRVAEEAAPNFPDGVCFVDLSNTRDSDGVLVAVARAIGVAEAIDRPLQDELVQSLRSRRVLLVLDNFEQVTEAAGLVARLLVDCPRLSVLATSREALHIRAEHVFSVSPMSLPPADAKPTAQQFEQYESVKLFTDRARAARPDFRLTDDNAAAVAEICRRLDGLPLAIELAAARLRLLSPEALRKQLHSRLNLLSGGPRDLPKRQQTLRAAINWSYELLDDAERRLFELLSVFADADLTAVEMLAEQIDLVRRGDPGVLEGLTGLIEKSLVRQVDADLGEPRVRMLETIREFAAAQLDRHPDFGARARRCHAVYYTDLARQRTGEMSGEARVAALDAMAAEAGNLRVAWDYWVAAGDLGQLERLAEGLLVLNDAHGWYLDTVRLTTDLLSVLSRTPSSPDHAVREIALRTTLARALLATQGFTPEVEKAFKSAVDLFERGVDVGARQKFSVLRGLFSLYLFSGQAERSEPLACELLSLAEQENDPRMLIDALLTVGAPLTFADIKRGISHLDRAISLFPKVRKQAFTLRGPGNDPRVSCLTSSAFGLWLAGHPDRAVERAAAAIALADELDHAFTSAYASFHAGLLHILRREFDLGRGRAARAQQIGEENGLKIWSAVGSCLTGVADTGLGRGKEGIAGLRVGMDLYRGLRSPPVFWPILLLLSASAYHRAGQAAEGLRHIDAASKIVSNETTGPLFAEFEITKGDLIALGGAGDSETLYRSAFDRAAAMGARMPQLRAATRLAQGWRARGDTDAIMHTLGPVYDTFDEGLATADLRDAWDVLAAVAPARYPPAAK